MEKIRKIQDYNRYYFLLRRYVDFLFKSAYRRVEYHGIEKIPKDGAIIYAPNHTNTLMDALAVLAIDRQAKVFVARADVFKYPTILKLLTFLKMLPINRKRDGMESLHKNEEINNIVVDVLSDKVPFCILPEGTHRPMHSLLPLQKGLFRIALQANDKFGDKMPLYIVPVGITFGHFFRYRSSLLVQIGEPINVTQFVIEHPELSIPQQITDLRNTLTDRLKKVILYIPDDANYNATLALAQLYGNEQHQRLRLTKNSIINRFSSAKETIRSVTSFIKSNPSEIQKILDMANDFSNKRHDRHIGIESVFKPHIRWSLIGKTFLLLLGFPCFIFSSVVTSPITILSIWLCSKFKDTAFHNTVRYLTSLILLPILLLLEGVTMFLLFHWIWGALFTLLFIPSLFFLHEYLRLIRRFISDIKWLTYGSLRKKLKDINSMISD